MTRKNGGRNNAVKHGAFAHDVILPGERAGDLEQIHKELIEEWKPDGPMEKDAVFSLALCFFSKRRLDRFYRQQALFVEEQPSDSESNDIDINLIDVLRARLDKSTTLEAAFAVMCVLPEGVQHQLKAGMPQPSSETDVQAWIAELKSKVDELIEFKKRGLLMEAKAEQAAKLYELTAEKIGTVERVEAMIDKLTRRLFQLKAFKEITNAHPAQPRILDVSPSATKNSENRKTN